MTIKAQTTQLTIDGGEVSHPPPAPRVTCPECEKTITLTRAGFYHKRRDDA